MSSLRIQPSTTAPIPTARSPTRTTMLTHNGAVSASNASTTATTSQQATSTLTKESAPYPVVASTVTVSHVQPSTSIGMDKRALFRDKVIIKHCRLNAHQTSASTTGVPTNRSSATVDHFKDKYISELEARLELVQFLADKEQVIRDQGALIIQLRAENKALKEASSSSAAAVEAKLTSTLTSPVALPAMASSAPKKDSEPSKPTTIHPKKDDLAKSNLASTHPVKQTAKSTRSAVVEGPPSLSVTRRASLNLRDLENESDTSCQGEIEIDFNCLDEYTEDTLIPWIELIGKTYPRGTLSNLKPNDRERIASCASQFLADKGLDPSIHVKDHKKQLNVPAIPKNKARAFLSFFNEQVDHGLLDSAKRKRNDSEVNNSLSGVGPAPKQEKLMSHSDASTEDLIEWHVLLKTKYPQLKLDNGHIIEKYRTFLKEYLARNNLPITVKGSTRKTFYAPRAHSVRILAEFAQKFPNSSMEGVKVSKPSAEPVPSGPSAAARVDPSILANSVLWSEAVGDKIGRSNLRLFVNQSVLFSRAKEAMRTFVKELSLTPSLSGKPKPSGLEPQIRVGYDDIQAFCDWFETQYKKDFRTIASPAKKGVDKTGDDAHPPASEAGPSSFVSKPDVTRYNTVLKSLLPDYNSTGREKRVAMKRSVKLYLMTKLGKESFNECVLPSQDGTSHTYGVPKSIDEEFRSWAIAEIKRIFDVDVVDGVEATE